jgi:cell division protein FtsW (lipid II flippase)
MTAAMKLAVAVTFLWLGMVLAISFLEAPLKFRAEGVTLRIGLSIGRLVFRALNAVEAVLAIAVVACLAAGSMPVRVVVPLVVAVVVLAVQLVAVRPRLTRRSDAVLAGEDAPRSRAHHAYIALEAVKTAALLVGGILLLVS